MAFYGGFMLEEVEIKEGVQEIGDFAFASAFSYYDNPRIKLPNSLRYLGSGSFSYNEALTIYYAGTEEDWNYVSKSDDWNYDTECEIIFDS